MLLLAGVTEVSWAVLMKMSDGFTRLLPAAVLEMCRVPMYNIGNGMRSGDDSGRN